VSGYPAETEVTSFRSRVKCGKCGGRRDKIDVRPNWKEQPTQPSLTGKQWAVTAHSDLRGVSQSVTDTGRVGVGTRQVGAENAPDILRTPVAD
jgi:hypothetical protein